MEALGQAGLPPLVLLLQPPLPPQERHHHRVGRGPHWRWLPQDGPQLGGQWLRLCGHEKGVNWGLGGGGLPEIPHRWCSPVPLRTRSRSSCNRVKFFSSASAVVLT